jgi:hypothetical protein
MFFLIEQYAPEHFSLLKKIINNNKKIRYTENVKLKLK